jgi:UDP-glucose 4-epimerase
LVIGANGFLGRHLTSALAKRGVDVRTLARRAGQSLPGVDHRVADLNDRLHLRSCLEGVDVVFHLAWTTVPQTADENPAWDIESNVIAGLGVLDACCAAGVQRVVFPSSGGTVYGDVAGAPDGTIDESAATNPIGAYGVTKLTFEKYLSMYRTANGLDSVILRVTNAYGEGQRGDRPQGLVGVALTRAKRDATITQLGDGSAVRDYLYVSDVVDALQRGGLAPLEDAEPRVFNVSSGVGHSVLDIFACIERVTGRRLRVEEKPMRACDLHGVVLANGLARRHLDWGPVVELDDGIERVWRSML